LCCDVLGCDGDTVDLEHSASSLEDPNYVESGSVLHPVAPVAIALALTAKSLPCPICTRSNLMPLWTRGNGDGHGVLLSLMTSVKKRNPAGLSGNRLGSREISQ
jgi:hypothetical protein